MESLNLKMFEELGRPHVLKKGDYVFKQNQLLEDVKVYYILEGEVEIRRKYTALKSDAFHYGRGEIFGVLEAYLGKSRITEAQCLTDVRLLGFTRMGIEKIMAANLSVSLIIIRSLSSILRQINENIKDLPA